MTETTRLLQPLAALEAAFDGHCVEMMDRSGLVRPLDVAQWQTATAVDLKLFIEHCPGMTIDAGCGPGRLTGALAENGRYAIGIDVSAVAVRQTRRRGSLALRRDLFDPLPAEGNWDHVLLADGNIGIGGDPRRLLRRVRRLIDRRGTIVVEVGGPGAGIITDLIRYRIAGEWTEAFPWAYVGVDAISEIAMDAGLRLRNTSQCAGRYVAVLELDHGIAGCGGVSDEFERVFG